MKTPDYLSYDRYKKKKKKDESQKIMLMFVTTFFITLLLFTVVANGLSPNVDVTIGNDTETDVKESGLGVKKFIDSRLKVIQMEDNSSETGFNENSREKKNYNSEGFDEYPQEIDEVVKLPGNKNTEPEVIEDSVNLPVQSLTIQPKPVNKDLSTTFVTPKPSKVYVGRYATIEQAKVAQEILLDSGLNIVPFVKDLGSFYTLQVGSYSSRAKAEGLAVELQKNNFPARVIQE